VVVIVTDDSIDDIASYWKQRRSSPKLVKVAKQVLCVPATSKSSEHSFFITGRTLEDRRTQFRSYLNHRRLARRCRCTKKHILP